LLVVHLPSNLTRFPSLPAVQRRHPRGTREILLRAATSRSWPGSQAHAAQDPRRDTARARHGNRAGPRGGIRSRYSGLRVQGTASSPSSTTGMILPRRSGICQRWRGEKWSGWSKVNGQMPTFFHRQLTI